MIRVEDVTEDNVEDIFRVCSYNKLEDPIQRHGISLKRQWLLDMLKEHGPCTKIAYLDNRPVAQILYYPEAAVPFIANPREDVIVLNCVYNPFPEAHGKGAGTALIQSLLDDCREGLPCLGGRACRFIVAKPFNTGEGIPLDRFYAANSFKQSYHEMYKEVKVNYHPREVADYQALPEDVGKAVMFYNPICEWSYPFAIKVREFLREIEPSLTIKLINEWRHPEESIRRGNEQLVVNTTPIKSFWTQREVFRREVELALDE